MQNQATSQSQKNHPLLFGIVAAILGVLLGGIIGNNPSELLQATALIGICFLASLGMYLYMRSSQDKIYLNSMLIHSATALVAFLVFNSFQVKTSADLPLSEHIAAIRDAGFSLEEAKRVAILERTGQVLPFELDEVTSPSVAEMKPPVFEAPTYNPPVYRPPVYQNPTSSSNGQATVHEIPKDILYSDNTQLGDTNLFNDLSELAYSKEFSISPEVDSIDLINHSHKYEDIEEDVFEQLAVKIKNLVPKEKQLATYKLVYHIVATSEEMLIAVQQKDYCGEETIGSYNTQMGLYNTIKDHVGAAATIEIASAIKDVLCHMNGFEKDDE